MLIQKGAGEHAGFTDADYRKAGAALVDAQRAWSADLVEEVRAKGSVRGIRAVPEPIRRLFPIASDIAPAIALPIANPAPSPAPGGRAALRVTSCDRGRAPSARRAPVA